MSALTERSPPATRHSAAVVVVVINSTLGKALSSQANGALRRVWVVWGCGDGTPQAVFWSSSHVLETKGSVLELTSGVLEFTSGVVELTGSVLGLEGAKAAFWKPKAVF